MPSRSVPRGGGRKTNVVSIATRKALTAKEVKQASSAAKSSSKASTKQSEFGPIRAGLVKPKPPVKSPSRAKKIATSRAAKDVKKVTKVAGPVGATAYVYKKVNDATKENMRKLEKLRREYDQSAAKGSMTFNDYKKKYGK